MKTVNHLGINLCCVTKRGRDDCDINIIQDSKARDLETKDSKARDLETKDSKARDLETKDSKDKINLGAKDFKDKINLGAKDSKDKVNLGAKDIYTRILTGCSAIEKKIQEKEKRGRGYIYLCEDDVLYHPSHFQIHKDSSTDNGARYNLNLIYLTRKGFTECGFQRKVLALSMCSGYLDTFQEYFSLKLDEIDSNEITSYEPSINQPRSYISYSYRSKFACIDIRSDYNTTNVESRAGDFFQKEPGWLAPMSFYK